jgi:hypothetical protein
VLALALLSKLLHLVDFSFKRVLEVEDNFPADYKEMAFVVGFSCTVALEVVTFLKNVSISEVTAFNVCNEGNQVGVLGSLIFSFVVICVFCPDL